jgi:hypothetical protein
MTQAKPAARPALAADSSSDSEGALPDIDIGDDEEEEEDAGSKGEEEMSEDE